MWKERVEGREREIYREGERGGCVYIIYYLFFFELVCLIIFNRFYKRFLNSVLMVYLLFSIVYNFF